MPRQSRIDAPGAVIMSSCAGLPAARFFSIFTENRHSTSDIVQQLLKNADEQLERKYKVLTQGYDIEGLARRVGQLMQISVTQVLATGKNRQTVRARSLLCYWAVRGCGMTMVSLSRKMGISSTAVSQSVESGEKIAVENNFELVSS